MSSLFPFLRSLLSIHQGHEGHGSIHQTIKDRDRGGFTTPDRQQDHLSYHDTGLRGQQGARIVLDAISANPFASKLTLSHNSLGDSGTAHFASRFRYSTNRRAVLIHELNLASNGLTDVGFSNILRCVGLAELYLSNNQITLNRTPSPMLSIGNLTLLSLTSNPLDCRAISDLFKDPRFSPNELQTLHLSVCGLDTSAAFALAEWLEDSGRSRRLEWLAVNGNNWGTVGCERVVWALARKDGNRNLLRVEMLACESPLTITDDLHQQNEMSLDDRNVPESYLHSGLLKRFDLKECRESMHKEGGWKRMLKKCEARNQILRLATRRAALGVLATARTVLLSSPNTNDFLCGQFPWNKLPGELQLHVWRWVALLSAFPGIINIPVAQLPIKSWSIISSMGPAWRPNQEVEPSLKTEDSKDIPDLLTTKQLNLILQYAQDRELLQEEIAFREQFIFNCQSKQASLHRRMVEAQRIDAEADRLGQLRVLKACGCEKFEGEMFESSDSWGFYSFPPD